GGGLGRGVNPRRPAVLGPLCLVVLFVGCAAPGAPSQNAGGGSTPKSGAPTTLTWAIGETPTDVQAISGVGGTRANVSAIRPIAHARLVVDDANLAPRPQLAVELPSTERGTWRVNPDGSMETVWKLRPDVK